MSKAEAEGQHEAPPPESPAPPRLIPTVRETFMRSVALGTGSGGLATLIAMLIHPAGPIVQLGALFGACTVGIDGFISMCIRHKKQREMDRAETRRAWIAAENDETLRKLKSTQLRHQECLAEKKTLAEDNRSLKDRVTKLEDRMDRMYRRSEGEIDEGLRREQGEASR